MIGKLSKNTQITNENYIKMTTKIFSLWKFLTDMEIRTAQTYVGNLRFLFILFAFQFFIKSKNSIIIIRTRRMR